LIAIEISITFVGGFSVECGKYQLTGVNEHGVLLGCSYGKVQHALYWTGKLPKSAICLFEVAAGLVL
jgi:hypothetical protein